MLVSAMSFPFKVLVRGILVACLVISLLSIFASQFDNTATPRQVRSPSHVINAVERHCQEFDIGGHMLNELGQAGPVHRHVTTCMIHSFSPYIEREAAKRFLDPARDNVYFANSPAITFHNNELVLVARIWLDRERYEPDDKWPANHFTDNWFYMQRFDTNMQPVTSGSILGIPSPKQWWVGDGPIEPRVLTTADGQLIVSFNLAMAFAKDSYMDYTVWLDVNRSLPIIPHIDGGTPMVNATEENDMPRDKHWMGFIESDEYIHFVHNLDPLRVLRCTLEGRCRFVQRDEQLARGQPESGFIFRDTFSHLRGGTPFELYRWPYYISIAHTTMYKSSNNHRYYSAHLVVLCVRPSYRVVYVSDAIQLHRRVYQAAPMVRSRYIDDGFIFPVGLIVETEDSLLIGGHVNDYSSIIVRLRGVKSVLNKVLGLDEKRKPRHGPPLGFIQKYVRDVLVNNTRMNLVHSH